MIIFCACETVKNSNKPVSTTSQSVNTQESQTLDFSVLSTLVYKTKNDYFNNVPVILSEDKTMIVSYPAPSDVYYNGKLAYPKRLDDNYLLDNRGINQNVAFLKLTYDEYSKLSKAPSIKEMYEMIIDKDPISELCNCGNRQQFKNEVSEINELVKNNLVKCQKLK